MLRKKSSFTSHTSSSSTNSPTPARPGTSASHHYQHDSGTGVRRALSSLQNALHPARRSHSTDSRTPVTIPEQYTRPTRNGGNFTTSSSVSDSRRSALNHSNYSAHSNGTTDSLYSSSYTMTPHTTDDDSSSTASHPIRLNRPRQTSKAGSLPSPLGSFLNDGSLALPTSSLQVTETTTGTENENDASSLSKGLTDLTVGLPMQLRVRHLDRGVIYSGYLTKFSSRTFFSRKQWKRRYFILHQTSLHCFKSSDPQHPLLESLQLCPETIICVTDIFSGKRYCLQITSPGEKNWYVLADTASEMSCWLRELKGTVQRFRSLPLDSRPGTHYSDSSEMSDLSSSSTVMADGAPAMPSIPGQYEPFAFVNRPSSPPPRPPHPSQQFNLYQFSSMGDPNSSASSRSATPKPLVPSAGSGFQGSNGLQGQVDRQESRRRKSNSVSAGQSPAEYASFGTVMEQAEALPLEGDRDSPFPPLSPPATPRYRRGSAIADFGTDRSTTSAKTTGLGLQSANNSARPMSPTYDQFSGAVAQAPKFHDSFSLKVTRVGIRNEAE
ncbi:hypothetical protein BGZ58_006688 [Dissophora ornata]|nr:hypothetical protein BGZ58_006688 [Dissophora ornata]